LDHDRDESFEAAEDGAMDDNRHVFTVIGTDILQAETLWKLVIQLDRSALPFAPDGIGDIEIDFRPIEGAVTFIQGVTLPGLVQSGFELAFCRVPGFDFTQEFRWPCRKLRLVHQSEITVNFLY